MIIYVEIFLLKQGRDIVMHICKECRGNVKIFREEGESINN